jgi:hypothetical protein
MFFHAHAEIIIKSKQGGAVIYWIVGEYYYFKKNYFYMKII